MDGGITIASEIERLIARLDGASICDDCIAQRLNFAAQSQVSAVTRGLGGARGYERSDTPCALCSHSRTTIRHRGK